MPTVALKFTHLVELLERLEQTKYTKAITTNRGTNPEYAVVRDWFRTHDQRIPRQGSAAVALLSCLFPERLTQRSYNIREQSLSHIIPRILAWGSSRAQTLRGWKDMRTEFAVLVESEMRQTENASPGSTRAVTVKQVDEALLQLAANSPYSAPRIREARNELDVAEVLGSVFSRMKSREVKWVVRLMLKDFRVVQVPEKVAKECFHFLLPDLLNMVHDFETAVEFLGQDGVKDWPYNPSPVEARRLKQETLKMFQPQLGRLVPRTIYDKARSLKHAVNLARSRTMSVERKYDGEYCQIHIQRGHDRDTIQIFSKSGKDSTMDRMKLHSAITAGLDLAGNACKIKSRCILEGELVVWSRSQQVIQPFFKIRNHVRHGGRRFDRAKDGPVDSQEQLMIIFYDLLVFDDDVRLTTPHQIRRQHLKGLVRVIPGVSNLVERQLVDFSRQDDQRACTEKLRQIFAHAITSRWEGLVLKGRDDPYLSFVNNPRGIKLKKDYLAQLGDAMDICIIGGRLDPRISNPGRLKWNTFYLACLTNKEAYQRFGNLQSFSIVDSICEATGAMPREDLEHLNAQGIFSEAPYSNEIKEFKNTVLMQGEPPTVLFRKPFVVECYGAGFDKSSDCAFWTLRFPRLARIHHDRSIADTMDFDTMQRMAEQAQVSPAETDEAEVQRWIQRLVDVEGKSDAARGALASPTAGSVPRTPHSATTASLSPVAARNRPPSLPLVWTQAHARTASASKLRISETSTRTPSTARTWASPSSSSPPGGVLGSESAPALAQNELQSPLLPSPMMIAAMCSKRRIFDVAESNISVKRPRLVAGRTILETPTPPREEIDLTRGSSSITPTRSKPPDRAVTVVQSFHSYLSPKRVVGGIRQFAPIPIPIPLPKFRKKPESLSPRRRGSSRALNLDGVAESPHRRHRASVSIERRPLAEMPSKSPVQKAPVSSSPAPNSPLQRKASKPSRSRDIDAHDQQIEQRTCPTAVADPMSALLTPASMEEAAHNATAGPSATKVGSEGIVAALAAADPSPVQMSAHNVAKQKSFADPPPQTEKQLSRRTASRGPMSHKDRLRAAWASTSAQIATHQASSAPPLSTPDNHAKKEKAGPRPLTIPSSPLLDPRTTPASPLIFLAHSALAGLGHDAGDSGSTTAAAAALRAEMGSVVDRMGDFVASVARQLATEQLGADERGKGKKVKRRFVVLVDSRAEPRVVAREVRDLAREVVRQAATAADGNSGSAAAPGVGAGSEEQVGKRERVVLCVFDFRVVAWLKRLRRAKDVMAEASEGGSEGEAEAGERKDRHGYRHGHGHEHFVCAVHFGGNVADDEGRVAAKVVWRS